MKKNIVILALILVTFLLQSTLRVVIPAQYSLPNLQVILTCCQETPFTLPSASETTSFVYSY